MEDYWFFETNYKRKIKLNNPILLEGLPGIGNVGKLVVDFLIDELKAKKLYNVFSYTFPHSVFVNEDNLVELPNIQIFFKKFNDSKKRDLLFLAGDIQPIDEVSSYQFCKKILELLKSYHGHELITIGGIGLQNPPKKPKIYCTGTSPYYINNFIKGTKINKNIYGIVGPIVGVTGLLVGLSPKWNIDGVALLSETFGHPMYLGMKSAKEILKVLIKKLKLKINLKKIDQHIKEIEEDLIKKTEELTQVKKEAVLKKLKKLDKETSYIG